MTSPRRFEQDLPGLLGDLYLAGTPDYRDDIVHATASIRQRPHWTFLERWIPMDVAMRRIPIARVPFRAIAVALLILLLAAATLLVVVGSGHRVPPPFGPARNGALAYTNGGDIFVRDSLDGPERILIGANGKVNAFWGWSPDGSRMLFYRTSSGLDFLFAADADGSHERQILDEPITNSEAAWSPDSRTVAVTVEDVHHHRQLYLSHVDGSAATHVDTPGIEPTHVAWRPPNGAQLLIRGLGVSGHQDLYLMNADGTNRRSLNLPSPNAFGPDWDLSGPSWSPTGDRIAYNAVEPMAGDPPGHYRVHLVNADGSGDRPLPGPSSDAVQEAWPVWSPDGRSIAVQRFTFGDQQQGWLALMPSDGSAAGRDVGPRTKPGSESEVVKTWTPDGTRLLSHFTGTGEVFSINPVTGSFEKPAWTPNDLPDMQRLAP
jgi:Tol biopolymer transport system component